MPEVRHIDLWNHNVEFLEQEDPWERPAVFVEFGAIEWEPSRDNLAKGRGDLSIHLVTDWQYGSEEAWQLSASVV